MAVSKILFRIDGDENFYREQCSRVTSVSNLLALKEACEAHLTEVDSFDGTEEIEDPDEGYGYQEKDVIKKSYLIQKEQLLYRLQQLKKERKKRQHTEKERKQTILTTELEFQAPKRTCWADPVVVNEAPIHTENRYETLNKVTEDPVTMDIVMENKIPESRSPPITFETQEDPEKILKTLSAINGEDLEVRCHAYSYTIKPKNLEAFDAIKEKLLTDNVPFFARTPKQRMPLKLVLKGFPLGKEKELREELIKMGYEPRAVTSLYKAKEEALPPPYVIALENRVENRELLNIKKVSFYKVKFQKLRRRQDRVLVCYNCQQTGHSSHNCFRKQACLNCGGDHVVKNCPRPKEVPPTCARCKGEHKATSTNCPLLQKTRKARAAKPKAERPPSLENAATQESRKSLPEHGRPKLSYAEAAKNGAGLQSSRSSFPLDDIMGSYAPNRISAFLEAYEKLKSASPADDIMMLRMDAMAAFLRLPAP